MHLRDVAHVQLGPEMRRGIAEADGEGEVVGGIVVMRFGENAYQVIQDVKRKIDELRDGLPPGVPGRFHGFQVGTSGAPGTDYAATYAYDDVGRLSAVPTGPGLPGGGATYAYMTDGPDPVADLVTEIEFKDAGQQLRARITRQFEQQRDLIDYVQNDWYDPSQQASTISKYDYSNDDLARRWAVVNTGLAFAGTGDRLSRWSYNDRNELTASQRYAGTDPNNPGDPVDAEHFGYAYDPIGNRITATVDVDPNDVETAYQSNSLNQYTRTHTHGSPPAGLFPSYDDDGNLVRIDVAGDMNCDGVVDGFDIQPFVLAITDPQQYQQQYPNCDIMHADLNGDGNVDGYDIQYLSGVIAAAGGSIVYTWDAENRLIAVGPATPRAGDKKVEFAYDYMGRRVEKRVSVWDTSLNPDDWNPAHDDAYVRRFIWAGVGTDGWLMLMELDGDNDALRKYTWGLDLAGQSGVAADVSSAGGVGHGGPALQAAGGIGGLLAVDQAEVGGGYSQGGIDAGQYVFFYDANGNVGQLVNLGTQTAQAAIVAHYEYDPYGDVIRTTGDYADDNGIRFSTKYFDAETGLGYWGYRYYSPKLGRWLSRDPLEEDGGLHLYGFVRNSPGDHVDPLGEFVFGSPFGCAVSGDGASSQPATAYGTCRHCPGRCAAESHAYGIAACEDGKPCYCVCVSRIHQPAGRRHEGLRVADAGIEQCVAVHEQTHVAALTCCANVICGGEGSECAASTASLDCTIGKISGCKAIRNTDQRLRCLRRLLFYVMNYNRCTDPRCPEKDRKACVEKKDEVRKALEQAVGRRAAERGPAS